MGFERQCFESEDVGKMGFRKMAIRKKGFQKVAFREKVASRK